VAAATLVLAITATAPGGVVSPSGDTGADRLTTPAVVGADKRATFLSAITRGEEVNPKWDSAIPAEQVAPVSTTSGIESAEVEKATPRGERKVAALTESSGTVVSAKEPEVRVEVAGIWASAVPDSCPAARRALRFYRAREASWLAKIGAGSAAQRNDTAPAGDARRRPVSSCPRYLAKVAQTRARAARRAWERFRTLRDFPIRPDANAWLRAVEEAQRPYPGTRGWLRSCSAPTSEGGWGRWVRYGGGPYYAGLENYDVSGGWLQFKFGTFKGFYRHAVDDVTRRGFKVERLDPVAGWLSPLGQALAGAWGYVNGLRGHWAGAGC